MALISAPSSKVEADEAQQDILLKIRPMQLCQLLPVCLALTIRPPPPARTRSEHCHVAFFQNPGK